LSVERAEVAADGDVAWPNLEVDPERFQDSATDVELERIIAEQPEVPRSAARCDAG
jgi:hypothetical protein